jgi:hypothetical protein
LKRTKFMVGGIVGALLIGARDRAGAAQFSGQRLGDVDGIAREGNT